MCSRQNDGRRQCNLNPFQFVRSTGRVLNDIEIAIVDSGVIIAAQQRAISAIEDVGTDVARHRVLLAAMEREFGKLKKLQQQLLD